MTQDIAFDEAIAFVWREADLLDRGDYDEWLDLWADDGLYIIPIEKDVDDYATVLNYIYDDAKMRRMRVARLTSSQSMSAATAAETVRTVSRFVETTGDGIGISLVRPSTWPSTNAASTAWFRRHWRSIFAGTKARLKSSARL